VSSKRKSPMDVASQGKRYARSPSFSMDSDEESSTNAAIEDAHLIRPWVDQFQLALLNASIAAQKHRRGACINGIIKTRTHLEESLEPSIWRVFLDRNTAVCSVLQKREQDRLRKKLRSPRHRALFHLSLPHEQYHHNAARYWERIW
ncbi:hypothetical protein Y032_0012g1598, partial [Ancylostoma ceylanicum]